MSRRRRPAQRRHLEDPQRPRPRRFPSRRRVERDDDQLDHSGVDGAGARRRRRRQHRRDPPADQHAAASFTVNLWSADDTKVFVKFSKPAVLASDGRHDDPQRPGGRLRRRRGAPVFAEAIAWFDCEVRQADRLRHAHVLRRRDHRRGDQRRRGPGGGDERHADEVRRRQAPLSAEQLAAPPEGGRSRQPTRHAAALAASASRRREGWASRARRTIRRSVAASISSRWWSRARTAIRSMEFGNVMDVTLRKLVDRTGPQSAR